MKPIAIETDTERLEIAIRRAGLHKYQVANRADMNATILSQILNGSRLPSRAECNALATATGVAVTKLFPDTLDRHALADGERVHPLAAWLCQEDKTQEQGAAEFGITQAFLSQIVKGIRRPSPETALRISRITGIDFKILLLSEFASSPTKSAASGGR